MSGERERLLGDDIVTDGDGDAAEKEKTMTKRMYVGYLDGSLSAPDLAMDEAPPRPFAQHQKKKKGDSKEDDLLLYDSYQASSSNAAGGAKEPLLQLPADLGRKRVGSGMWGEDKDNGGKPQEFRRRLRRPLQTAGRKVRRQAQAKRPARDGEDSTIWRLSSYSTCAEFDLESMLLKLDSSPALQKFEFSVSYYLEDVIRLLNRRTQQVVFIFEYGCLALFNVREADERLLARSLQKYGSGLLAEKDWSSEDFKYTYADEKDGFAVQSDTIFFRSHGSLEKLSVGYALAQCVKLSVLESRGERAIEENRGVSDSLAGSLSATGDVKMNRADIHMRLGRLFVIRSDLNLHSDILDTPEFFWERDRYVEEYTTACKYLEIGSRVSLLNNRISIMCDLLELTGTHLDRRTSEKRYYGVFFLIALIALFNFTTALGTFVKFDPIHL